VIAVFTKYDQFRRNIKINLEDEHRDPSLLHAEVESVFNKHYLGGLTGPPPFIRLESEISMTIEKCTEISSLLQECTNLENSVITLLKRLSMHSVAMSFP
jgi:hypothetical protein